jgi:hypothetical protein
VVTRQLDDVAKLFASEPEACAEFLAATTGLHLAQIDMASAERVIVWPTRGSGTERDSVAAARLRGFHTIGFVGGGALDYSFALER